MVIRIFSTAFRLPNVRTHRQKHGHLPHYTLPRPICRPVLRPCAMYSRTVKDMETSRYATQLITACSRDHGCRCLLEESARGQGFLALRVLQYHPIRRTSTELPRP